MAVYTQVDDGDLNRLLADFDLGAVVSFAGVEQGVENTNYILTTTKGRFVLTLFEKRVDDADLPFFMAAMAHLACRGIPAPRAIADRRGAVVTRVRNRSAVIMSFLDGRQRMAPTPEDCRLMGGLNARLHIAAAGFSHTRQNALGLAGWKALAARCGAEADVCAQGLASLVADEIDFLSDNWPAQFPGGLVHADLFPDNVFFDETGISGVIDFYFACTELFAYDLALTLNAWASENGQWRVEHARALIDGYDATRRLEEGERAAMPVLLRGAALRIMLTRLNDFLHQVDGALVAVKDPLEYRDLLRFHRGGGSEKLFWKSG